MLTRETLQLPTLPEAIPETVDAGKLVEVVAAHAKTINALRKEHYGFMRSVREFFDRFNRLSAQTGSSAPVPTASVGAFTTVSAAIQHQKVGNRIEFTVTVTITTNGTAAGYVSVPMPFAAAEITGVGGIRDNGTALCGSSNGTSLNIYKYDGTYPGGTGTTLYVSGSARV